MIQAESEVVPQIPQKRGGFRKLAFLVFYLTSVPIFIGFVVLFSLSTQYTHEGYISRQKQKPQYQALPSENTLASVSVENGDARILALEEFFAKYESPLQGHGKAFVEEADKNNIDYRLLPAIAMQESTLCKKIIANSHNCWGWGIYGKNVMRFKSFEEAIAYISQRLSVRYVQKGFETPEEIVQKYTPSDDGKWSGVVSMMMDRIRKSL